MSVETHYGVGERIFRRHLVRWILNRAGNPRISIRLWDGDEYQLTTESLVACMELLTPRAALELLRSPSIGFGENYSKGLIEIHGDLLAFVNEVTAARTQKCENNYYGPRIRSKIHAMRGNSLVRARQNIHHHYDLGNEFYKLWLDEHMVYTCAYLDSSTVSLAEAQVAKLEHICHKLNLRPGQNVVEAGCGWGTLSLHMAAKYGVSVVAYNNSGEQVAYARERAVALGLEHVVEFVEDDYRNIARRCDAFVSVGMLEHVGLAGFSALGRLIKRVLKPDGIGLIHSIGRSRPQRMDPWIVKHIFPGGYIPSLAEVMAIFEPNNLSVLDVENLRPHYARTCEMWLRNFDAVKDVVTDMYGAEFARMWRLYLAGSSAGFQSGTLQLYQVLFTPLGNDKIPWTRNYQYQPTPRVH